MHTNFRGITQNHPTSPPHFSTAKRQHSLQCKVRWNGHIGNLIADLKSFIIPCKLSAFLVIVTTRIIIWVIGVPQNGWFISWKTLSKWMIWGENPLFSGNRHIFRKGFRDSEKKTPSFATITGCSHPEITTSSQQSPQLHGKKNSAFPPVPTVGSFFLSDVDPPKKGRYGKIRYKSLTCYLYDDEKRVFFFGFFSKFASFHWQVSPQKKTFLEGYCGDLPCLSWVVTIWLPTTSVSFQGTFANSQRNQYSTVVVVELLEGKVGFLPSRGPARNPWDWYFFSLHDMVGFFMVFM